MPKRPMRVYADTSVYGDVFEDEFREASLPVFDLVREGSFVLVVGDITLAEIDGAPQNVQNLLRTLAAESVERVLFTEEVADFGTRTLKRGWLDRLRTAMRPTSPPLQ